MKLSFFCRLLLCGYFFRSYVYGSSSLPNIIFLLIDDLGWNDVSYHNGSDFQTPAIDSLAKEGLQLDNYYIQSTCTPTRSALMSGRYPIHTGLQLNIIPPMSPFGLPLDETIIPQDLKRAGYDTHMLGKWHLGFCADAYLPNSRGFDSYFGFYTGNEDYYYHNSTVGGISGYDLRWQTEAIMRPGEYSTYMYGNATMDILQEYDDNPSNANPFFISPRQAPQSIIDSLEDTIDDEERRTLAAMTTVLDDVIAQLVYFMKFESTKNIWDNLLFILSTDNGGSVKGASSNFPLRGGKGTLWEGGVKGVGFIAGGWLNNNRKSASMSALMHITDWYPTLCEIAGVKPSHAKLLDGYSQLSNIQNAVSNETESVSDIYSPRSEILLNIDVSCEVGGVCGGLRYKQYKLVVGNEVTDTSDKYCTTWCPLDINLDGHTLQCSVDGNNNYPIVDDTYIANNCPYNDEPCLYNIEDDPCEYYDLKHDLPDIYQELYSRLLFYNSSMVTPLSLIYSQNSTAADPENLGGFWGPWVNDQKLSPFWEPLVIILKKKGWLNHLVTNMAVVLL